MKDYSGVIVLEMLTQLISTVGFPIAVTVYLLWYVNKQSAQHKEEMDNVTQAIQNNTLALTQLIDAITYKGGMTNGVEVHGQPASDIH